MTNYNAEGEQLKPRIRSWQNFHPQVDGNAETIIGTSMMVPGMTLSMREIVARFKRGDSLPAHDAHFDSDNPVPDVNRMDKLEIIQMIRQNNQIIEHHQGELNRKASTQKAAAAAAEKAEFARLKAFEQAHQVSDTK